MFMHLHAASRFTKSFQNIIRVVTVFFMASSLLVPGTATAQNLPSSNIQLPVPGVMVQASAEFTPALMRGLRVYPDNPLMFDFIIDQGEEDLTSEELQTTSQRLIKYFLASLTIPEDKMWVNLSPYEQQRIISDELEITEMGRDLLSMDYLLKQLTASLMYPEDQLGQNFWERVKSEAMRRYGSSDIPMNTFNKIWVVPADAQVFEMDGSAYVIESRLKVMLEEDYLALEQNSVRPPNLSVQDEQVISGITSDVVRDVLIPEIEKEINNGRHFAKLRQIYDAMILATWYKQNLRQSLLGQVYVDQAKMKGIDVINDAMKERIYRQYLEAFKVGVYNYVKEDYDATLEMEVPRKYFSGGASMNVSEVFRAQTAVAELDLNQFERFLTLLDSGRLSDPSRQQVIARIQSMQANDRARMQELVRSRAIPDSGIARIVEVQISLLENAPVELDTVADAAILNTARPDVPAQTVRIANREMRPEDALGAIAEVRRMISGAVPQIDVPTYPIPSQTRPKLLLAALEEGLGDNPISNRRWRNFESLMNEVGDALGIFIYSDFTGTEFAGSPVERTFQLDTVGGKITNPSAVGTAFYTELPGDPQEVTTLIQRINEQLDLLEAEARPALDENIAQMMSPETEGQVVILANTGFETDARAVGRFLTAGRSNVLGLMGPANLTSMGFTDPSRPKAIGFSRAELEAAGIAVPEDGVIDSDFLTTAQLQPLQQAIQALTDQKAEGDATVRAARLFGEIIENLDPQVNPQTPVQVQLAEATQNFLQPSFGFTGPEDVQAVFPMLDIRIRDARGTERTIWVHRRSPVLTDEVEVLGIGPETERVWRSIISNAAGVIVVGDTGGLEGLFSEASADQTRIQIGSRDVNTLQELGRDMYWRDLSNRIPTGSSINELAALSEAREQLAPTDERYQLFDPRGELAAGGIQIFIVDDLLEGTRRIADEQGVQLGTDMLIHPGVVGNSLFFSPEALNIISQQSPEYRAALARHHLVHIQRPELSESQVNAIAALPRLNDPAFATPGTPRLARLASTPQEFLNAAAERLVSELGVGIITRNILSPDVEAYEAVDPLDILAEAGIRVYTVPNLMATALELAAESGLDLPADAVIQPGLYNGDLYVDANAVDILYAQSEEFRTALARHYLLQWQFQDVPELEVADIERIAPRPQLDDPVYGPAPFRNVEAQSEALPQLRQAYPFPRKS